VNKYLTKGEGWVSAQLLTSPKSIPVSIKVSSRQGTLEIFAEPEFDLLETVRLSDQVTVDPLPTDSNILELHDPDRVEEGLGPLLFICDRPELFRAIVGSFRSTSS